MALSKHPFIYKAINEAINKFGEANGLTARQHFAPLLGFTGPNGHIQIGTHLNYITYNHAAPHPLSVDHLAVLLDELGEHRSIIIDALLKEHNMVAVKNEDVKVSHHEVHVLVDNLSMEEGDVFRVAKEALRDGKIDSTEKDKINKELDEVIKAALELKTKLSEI